MSTEFVVAIADFCVFDSVRGLVWVVGYQYLDREKLLMLGKHVIANSLDDSINDDKECYKKDNFYDKDKDFVYEILFI